MIAIGAPVFASGPVEADGSVRPPESDGVFAAPRSLVIVGVAALSGVVLGAEVADADSDGLGEDEEDGDGDGLEDGDEDEVGDDDAPVL